jgi:hypothetical protein
MFQIDAPRRAAVERVESELAATYRRQLARCSAGATDDAAFRSLVDFEMDGAGSGASPADRRLVHAAFEDHPALRELGMRLVRRLRTPR